MVVCYELQIGAHSCCSLCMSQESGVKSTQQHATVCVCVCVCVCSRLIEGRAYVPCVIGLSFKSGQIYCIHQLCVSERSLYSIHYTQTENTTPFSSPTSIQQQLK